MSAPKPCSVALIVCIAVSALYMSCRKSDHLASSPSSTDSNTERFFRGSESVNAGVAAISATIRRENNDAHFLDAVIRRAGYPRWDKIKETSSYRGAVVQAGRTSRSSGASFYYIPFCQDSSTIIKAVLIVKATSTDTVYRMLYHWQYQTLSFTKTTDSVWAASDVFHLFTSFQQDIFGQKKFIIRDGRLLRPAYANRRGVITTIRPHASADTLSLNVAGEDCDGYDYCYNPNGDGECPGGGCKQGCQYWIYEEWNCTDYTILPGTGSGGGSGNGPATPGAPGSGSGGGGNWYDNPCKSTSAAGSSPCDGNGGGSNSPGWEPLITPEPPYQCTYQLSTHEQGVFDQLDQEDAEGNAVHQGSACQGTKRSGNIWFQGTKEHWLLQLDYISKNPVYGEREFAVPNAGNVPGATGYADIVNLLTGNMFEIKPDNFTGAYNGTREVENYVTNANINCTTTLPSGTFWNAGQAYAPVILPTALPNKYLQAKRGNPGVILYSYITTVDPTPAPITIPVSVLEKLRYLVDRLKKNWASKDAIIAEFLTQNPDVVYYIKVTAIGAGVAIIVATILEDLLTFGDGILDDWACFTLAWRIVRFAIAI